MSVQCVLNVFHHFEYTINETNNTAFYDEYVLLFYSDGMHLQDTVISSCIISTIKMSLAFDM